MKPPVFLIVRCWLRSCVDTVLNLYGNTWWYLRRLDPNRGIFTRYRFAYRTGTCPGDVLSELAQETDNHYYRNEHQEQESENEADKERQLQHREEELQQELEFPAGETFESGSGEISGQPSDTSFMPFPPETQIDANEREGSQPERSPGEEENQNKSFIDRIHSFINGVGDIFS